MYTRSIFVLIFLALWMAGSAPRAAAQEPGQRMTHFVDPAYRVIDFIDPGTVLPHIPEGDWSLEFIEIWTIDPDKQILQKEVNASNFIFPAEPELSQDTLRSRISALLSTGSKDQELVRIKNITYEFTLLDPHTPGSNNKDFAGPGGMDPETRRLHQGLISLVRGRSAALARADLDELLLSVYFHETWEVDPSTLQFYKKVDGITPVLWQRRQTSNAEPVDDAETGLPVYYKNLLDRIDLRNP